MIPYNKADVEYYLECATRVSKLSYCDKRPVGAVIVKEGHIIGSGFNQRKIKGLCSELKCPGLRGGECTMIHAEVAAIITAQRHHDIADSVIYITTTPCQKCIETAGFARVKKLVWPTGEFYYN